MQLRWKGMTPYVSSFVVSFAVLALTSCESGPGGQSPGAGRTPKFKSVDEHLAHSSVSSAVARTGHAINRGSSPPSIAGQPLRGLQPAAATGVHSGEYRVSGRVTDVSEGASIPTGTPVGSVMCLHDQGADGSISIRENVLGINVDASGFITGSGDKFTTYFQSHQDLAAQLRQLSNDAPDLGICVADVSLIASGRRAADGRLVDFRTLSTITSFYCPNLYDLAVDAGASPSDVRTAIENIENSWWRTLSTATPRGTCSQ